MKPLPLFSGILATLLLILASSLTALSQNVAINTTGNAPDASAMLDIVNSSKGMLIPRVSLTSTTDASTISNPATSLIVFNTNGAITGDNADSTGYYYNAGTSGSPNWVKLMEQAAKWDDLRINLDNGSNGATFDYLSGSSGPQIYYFRNSAPLDMMSFTVQLPHSWKQGTTIYPHLHWIPKTTAATGNVEWNLDYSWANYDPTTPEIFPAITTTTVTATAPAGGFTARAHTITALTTNNDGIDGAGKKISSILICRIWRKADNAADTYAYDAGVLYLDFHIQVDGWGSKTEYVK